MRRALSILMFLAWPLAWQAAAHQTPGGSTAAPTASEKDPDRDFLVWEIEDVKTSQALAEVCKQKRVAAELKSLCTDMVHTRELQLEIASRYFVLFYREEPPVVNPSPSPLAYEEGTQFTKGFLKIMIHRDEDARKKAQKCLSGVGREEIRTFCRLVEKSRLLEALLLQNHLCQLRKNCKSKQSNELRDRVDLLQHSRSQLFAHDLALLSTPPEKHVTT